MCDETWGRNRIYAKIVQYPITWGQIITNQVARRVPLQLQGKYFTTSLIVLPTQKVDIILGMNWMGDHGVLLDTASQHVHIDSPLYGSMTLNLMDHISSTPTVNQVEAKSLAEIPVMCEYPDVFRMTYQACHLTVR